MSGSQSTETPHQRDPHPLDPDQIGRQPTSPSQRHAIAPATVLRGSGAWRESLPAIATLSRQPLLLGRSAATRGLRGQLREDLESAGLEPLAAELAHDCCEIDLQRLAQQAREAGCDAVLAAGGGKVLDAGKLLADRLGLDRKSTRLNSSH